MIHKYENKYFIFTCMKRNKCDSLYMKYPEYATSQKHKAD